MTTKSAVVAATFLLSCCIPAGAANITYNATVALDPTALMPKPNNYFNTKDLYVQYVSGFPTVNVQSGDTVTGTITFTNGSLGLENAAGDFSWGATFEFFGNAGTAFSSTVNVLGLTGTLGTSNPTPNSGVSYGNSVFEALIPGLQNQDYTFTGMTFTLNVSSIAANSGPQTSVPFSFSRIEANADTITVNTGAATPEPASASLAAAALGLAAMARRRRATPSATGC